MRIGFEWDYYIPRKEILKLSHQIFTMTSVPNMDVDGTIALNNFSVQDQVLIILAFYELFFFYLLVIDTYWKWFIDWYFVLGYYRMGNSWHFQIYGKIWKSWKLNASGTLFAGKVWFLCLRVSRGKGRMKRRVTMVRCVRYAWIR